MGKIVLLFIFCSFTWADNIALDKDCLNCHKAQQIPSELIYKRYLMQYSTEDSIENAMFNYLEHPNKEDSIMPPQFFLKFPMKKLLNLDKQKVRKNIQAYIQTFDIKPLFDIYLIHT